MNELSDDEPESVQIEVVRVNLSTLEVGHSYEEETAERFAENVKDRIESTLRGVLIYDLNYDETWKNTEIEFRFIAPKDVDRYVAYKSLSYTIEDERNEMVSKEP